jgi:NAD-dependent deacetylase sirtuin 4
MVGWRDFDTRQPNAGHVALRDLELIGKLGVTFEDSTDYHAISDQYYFGSGWNQVSIITQNVDHLHQRAGSQYVTELHGRTSRLKCMSCGHYRDRTDFTLELEDLNRDWLTEALANRETTTMRPDGDAQLQKESYDDLFIPSCLECESGFLKPDVVFFGDSVPLHRVSRCSAAVKNCDGLLCVGTSLAVHSALRFVKLASSLQKPIFILTVGGTRADNLPGVVKVQAPIGATLTGLVGRLAAAGEESVSIRA